MRLKCKSDSSNLPLSHEYYICFPLTVSQFSRYLRFNMILNLGSYSFQVSFSSLNLSVAFLSKEFECISRSPDTRMGYLLGQSRVKEIVPRRGLWRFFGCFFFKNKFTVPLFGHPEWCGCKEAWTEFFIIGLWDFQSLFSNQVHMPIVMDSTLQLLCPRQHTHTNQN